jgi:short-subunit dehydrogenase
LFAELFGVGGAGLARGFGEPRGKGQLVVAGLLMTGSNASLRGYPNWSVYAGSKAVLPAYARVWVSELRDRKIRVNVLTPARSPHQLWNR